MAACAICPAAKGVHGSGSRHSCCWCSPPWSSSSAPSGRPQSVSTLCCFLQTELEVCLSRLLRKQGENLITVHSVPYWTAPQPWAGRSKLAAPGVKLQRDQRSAAVYRVAGMPSPLCSSEKFAGRAALKLFAVYIAIVTLLSHSVLAYKPSSLEGLCKSRLKFWWTSPASCRKS